MKRVFSTIGETCHAYAHNWRTLGNGRNSTGNVFFQQATIFSYGGHFPMAKFTETASGETCILITSDSYSVSTAKHMNNLHQAVSHIKSFTVSDVQAETPQDHMRNWTELRSNLNAARNALRKAREPSQWHIDVANRCADIANDYAEAFKLKGLLESHQFPLVAYKGSELAELRTRINTARN